MRRTEDAFDGGYLSSSDARCSYYVAEASSLRSTLYLQILQQAAKGLLSQVHLEEDAQFGNLSLGDYDEDMVVPYDRMERDALRGELTQEIMKQAAKGLLSQVHLEEDAQFGNLSLGDYDEDMVVPYDRMERDALRGELTQELMKKHPNIFLQIMSMTGKDMRVPLGHHNIKDLQKMLHSHLEAARLNMRRTEDAFDGGYLSSSDARCSYYVAEASSLRSTLYLQILQQAAEGLLSQVHLEEDAQLGNLSLGDYDEDMVVPYDRMERDALRGELTQELMKVRACLGEIEELQFEGIINLECANVSFNKLIIRENKIWTFLQLISMTSDKLDQ
ncbi:unnamed protein product [Owenia fusiformis]|uniref:Uncharacterized protein n=1 Tax=Owenia fusiformis TaxID=6347 RepID=A0A8J1UZ88_OWEFU|nr:unnamed protein product [Owenia fusiformis]